jgi:hypothetical protein
MLEVKTGLATKLGVGAAALGGLLSAVSLVLKGDHSEATIGGLIVSASAVYAVVTGRMNQAVAIIAKHGAS